MPQKEVLRAWVAPTIIQNISRKSDAVAEKLRRTDPRRASSKGFTGLTSRVRQTETPPPSLSYFWGKPRVRERRIKRDVTAALSLAAIVAGTPPLPGGR